MYVQKGQTIFNVFNPGKSWVLLNLFSPRMYRFVKTGQTVSIIIPEVAPEKLIGIRGFSIEPFFRPEVKRYPCVSI